MSANGLPPFTAADIADDFGSGGKGIAPNQGQPAIGPILKDILSRLPAGGIQSGSGVLVLGVSATIAATITASSKITVTAKDVGASSALGRLEAKAADRIVGAPGTFKVTATKASDGTTETGDVSTFDWTIVG